MRMPPTTSKNLEEQLKYLNKDIRNLIKVEFKRVGYKIHALSTLRDRYLRHF